jgi:glycosyltransferase involved in cell wall biosynthesis
MSRQPEDKLRAMIVVPNMPTRIEQITGGVHSAVMNLLRGFAETGETEILLVSITEELKEPLEIQFAENVRIYYMPEGPMPSSSLNYFFVSVGRLRKLIKQFRPHLVHYQIGGTLLFTRWASMFSLPHLITIHGIPWAEFKVAKEWKQRIAIFVNALIGDWLYPNNIIQISSYLREQFKIRKHQTLCVIPNAIPSRYAGIPLKAEMTNHLVFVGVLNDRKNPMLLLEILNELNKQGLFYTVEFCGGFGSPDYQELMENYIRTNGLEKQVRFNGWVAYSEVPAILERADMLVLTSRQETLPMSIAEAMAAGRPVLATRVGGIPEMIEEGKTGFLFDLDSISPAVSALKNLYNDSVIMQQMGKIAKQKAIENYMARSVAEKTERFYLQLVKSEKSVPAV